MSGTEWIGVATLFVLLAGWIWKIRSNDIHGLTASIKSLQEWIRDADERRRQDVIELHKKIDDHVATWHRK